MYICYIDESGHCGKKFNSEQPVEVLCGIITDLTKWNKTHDDLQNMVDTTRKHKIDISEFKGSDIYGGRDEWRSIDPKVRDKVYQFLINWMDKRYVKISLCPIDSKSFFGLKNEGNEFANLFKYPYEAGAFNVILSIQREKKGIKQNKGKTFIVLDEQSGHDENLISIFEGGMSFTDSYTGYKTKPRARIQPRRLNQIIDIPFFSKSHLAALIQPADFTVYIATRYLLLKAYGFKEKYDGESEKIETLYSKIMGNLIKPTSIDPPGMDGLCQFYRDVRPSNWSAKNWKL